MIFIGGEVLPIGAERESQVWIPTGSPPPSGIAFIDGVFTLAGTSSGINTTGANFGVIAASFFSGTTTVSDSLGNSWNALSVYAEGNCKIQLWWSILTSVGAGHTFSITGSAGSVGVVTFSGVNAVPFDSENGNNSSGSGSIQPGSVTPSLDGSVLVTGLDNFTATTPSINGGFTSFGAGYAGGTLGGGIAYLIQTSAAAANPTWTYSSANIEAASIAVFKPA